MLSRLRPKSEFIRHILTLITGTTIAQVIPLIVTPVLTRIYSPEDFGLFALYMSIIAILGVLATGRYELAIMLPEKDEDALNIVYISLIITLFVSSIILIIIAIFNSEIANILGNSLISTWLYIIPISVLFIGINQTLNYWNNRNKLYYNLGNSRITQSLSASCFQYLAGINLLVKNGGLIIGYIIGQFMAILYLLLLFIRYRRSTNICINRTTLTTQLVRYKDYPIKNIPGAFIDALASWMPVFLLGFLYSPASAGIYLLTIKVINLPMTFIGAAFSQVYYRKATELSKIGSLYQFVLKTSIILSIIITLPMITIMIWGPELFTFVFDKKWLDAGKFSQLLAPMTIISFVYSCQSTLLMVANKLNYQILFFSILIISQTIAFVSGYYFFHSYFVSIFLFSLTGSLLYAYSVFWISKTSKKIDSKFTIWNSTMKPA